MGRLLSVNLNTVSVQASFNFSDESHQQPFQKSDNRTAVRILLIDSKTDMIQEI